MKHLKPGATLVLALSVLRPAVSSPPLSGNEQVTVQGRIEVVNSKTKLESGAADAGGVVVWLMPLKEAARPENVSPTKRRLEQRDKRFIPHVMVIQVGAEIDFPNHDPFFHNVFSVYDGKTFDLGLYANGESRPVRFNRPGISYIYCNIHPQMSAVIVTVETPYFTVSEPDGDYVIRNVPLGEYRLNLWHERCDTRQLSARTRIVSAGSVVTDLGIIRLDEAGYVTKAHKDKHGEEYDRERDLPAYRRP
jgi:plastocyanin